MVSTRARPLAALLLAVLVLPVLPAAGDVETRLGNGPPTLTLDFPDGGGTNQTAYLSLNKDTVVAGATFRITGLPSERSASVRLDSDGDFNGAASGMTNTTVSGGALRLSSREGLWKGLTPANLSSSPPAGLDWQEGYLLNSTPATSLAWERSTDGPAPRYRHSAVWNGNDAMLLFGGFDGSNFLNDTWLYYTSNATWRRVRDGPPPRYGHVAVWDDAAKVMLVFGGEAAGGRQNDTWRYDPASDAWAQRAPGASPRRDAAGAWDPGAGRLIVAGGLGPSSTYLNDTWSYAPGSDTWTRLANGTMMPRYGHSAVWNDGAGKMVVHGGLSPAGYLNDTWSFDPGSGIWTRLANGSSPRAWHGAAWRAGKDEMYIYGGYRFEGGSVFLGDLLQYDYPMNAWSTLTPDQPLPAARDSHTMVWTLPGRDMGIVFGGRNFNLGGTRNDTWNLTYLPGTRKWLPLQSAPAGRYGQAAAWSPTTERLYVYSGSSGKGDLIAYDARSDGWTTLASGPAARQYAAGAWDGAEGMFIVHGGLVGATPVNETWLYDPVRDYWQQRAGGAPARSHHASALSYTERLLYIFGGEAAGGAFLSDIWTYSAARNTWVERSPPLPAPVARRDGSLTWNGSGLILFGGYAGGALNDTWFYSPAANAWRRGASAPFSAYGHSAAWDWSEGVLLVLADAGLWAYDPATDAWSGRVGYGPSRRYAPAFWDPAGERMLLFGGQGPSGALDDTAAYAVTRNHPTGSRTMTLGTADMGETPEVWTLLGYNGTASSGTAVEVSARTSGDGMQWSQWEVVDARDATIAAPPGRYIQWRTTVTTLNATRTPYIHDLFAGYRRYSTNGTWSLLPAEVEYPLRWAAVNWSGAAGGGAVNISVSADNGTSWTVIGSGGNGTFSGTGRVLAVRVNLTGNGVTTPAVDALDIAYGWASLPSNLTLDLGGDGTDDWSAAGEYGSSLVTPDLATSLNDYLRGHAADADASGFIRVPLVLASDSAGRARISDIFILYEVNRAPRVDLLSPVNGSTVNNTTVLLQWDGSDQNTGQNLTFTVFLDVVNGTNMRRAGSSAEPSHIATNLTSGRRYFWRVTASDGYTNTTSPTWSFIYDLHYPNRLPVVTPPEGALNLTAEATFRYRVNASDPDGDALVFTLVNTTVPGLSLAQNGTLSWTPSESQAGNYTLRVRVFDGYDATEFNLSLHVFPPKRNHPPEVKPVPSQKALSGQRWNYRLLASDPENDTLNYSLVNAPEGVVLDNATGLMTWVPAGNQTGNWTVEVNISDGNLSAILKFSINVTLPVKRPAPNPWAFLGGLSSLGNWWLLIVGIVVGVAAGIGAGYWMRGRRVPGEEPAPEQVKVKTVKTRPAKASPPTKGPSKGPLPAPLVKAPKPDAPEEKRPTGPLLEMVKPAESRPVAPEPAIHLQPLPQPPASQPVQAAPQPPPPEPPKPVSVDDILTGIGLAPEKKPSGPPLQQLLAEKVPPPQEPAGQVPPGDVGSSIDSILKKAGKKR